jgi:hypothetical protein
MTAPHVEATLVQMLKAWPTLRGTRLDCLEDLATASEYDAKWLPDGSLWVNSDKITAGSYPDKPEEEDEDVVRYRDRKATRYNAEALASRLLQIRRDRITEAFNRDNAEEIIAAGNRYSNPFRDYDNAPGWDNTLPRGGYSLLANVPQNADQEWVKAFIELMEETLAFEYPLGKFASMSPAYKQQYLDDLARAKKEAREVLVRLKGTDEEKVQQTRDRVQAQIDALVKSASALGVKVEATVVVEAPVDNAIVAVNSPVRIVLGIHKGKSGRVIEIDERQQFPYLIEFDNRAADAKPNEGRYRCIRDEIKVVA